MNVYDEVNNLARAIKECREFTEYKEAKEKNDICFKRVNTKRNQTDYC